MRPSRSQCVIRSNILQCKYFQKWVLQKQVRTNLFKAKGLDRCRTASLPESTRIQLRLEKLPPAAATGSIFQREGIYLLRIVRVGPSVHRPPALWWLQAGQLLGRICPYQEGSLPQHSSSWYIVSSSSWDSRCSSLSVLPLIISSGVFINLPREDMIKKKVSEDNLFLGN